MKRVDYDEDKQEQREVVIQLQMKKHIKSQAVIEAMTRVDLKMFYPKSKRDDWKIIKDIGENLETACQVLKRGYHVLDVCREMRAMYELVCLSLMVGPSGHFLIVADSEADVQKVQKRLAIRGLSELLDSKRLELVAVSEEEEKWQLVTSLCPFDMVLTDSMEDAAKIKKEGMVKEGGLILTPFYEEVDLSDICSQDG
jgi:CheY-like chemotaxis protein